MLIMKRNGKQVEFDLQKIVNAVAKANAEVDPIHQMNEHQILAIAQKVTDACKKLPHIVSVEEVQDMVETAIMEMRGYEVAQKYVRYRYKRELSRKVNTTDDSILTLIDQQNEELKQENSNKNPVINSTQRDYMAGEVSKDLTRRVLLPEEIVHAHDEGIIHFHDMDYFAQKEHNCFSGGTKFITDSGIRKFSDFQDGDQVYVKDLNGAFRLATVHVYGRKPMQKVILKNPKMTQSIICTPDHRWILRDGTVTTSLKVGDVLAPTKDSTAFEIQNVTDAKAFCIGFAIGDGTDISPDAAHPEGGTKIRLCGEKNRYSKVFKMAGYREREPFPNGDRLFYIGRSIKQNFLNGKAWRFLTPEQQKLVFHGYYAADGASNANKVCTADERVASMIEDISGMAGYYISSKTDEIRDTNYKKDAKLISYHFITATPVNWCWKVVDIIPDNHKDALAYCVEEPVTKTFTLERGIVTGNCDLINLEDMLQNGTVISGTMIEKPHSFFTACNVTTQIVAQVASNQYGGQSFSLAHLAPFVDVSRKKIRSQVMEERKECDESLDEGIISKVVEKRLRNEIKSGIQTIQYQLITLMTCNGQAPFVTMFMYLDEVPEGQTRDDLAMIIEEVLIQRMQGVKNEKGVWITPAFPKLIYVLDEDNVTEGSKYWHLTELAAKCTAKRMVPDYISAKKMRELKQGDVYTCMGCRSFLTVEDSLRNPDGSHKFYGRFNQGVVTINLVDVACSSEGDMDKFWKILDERLELCHRALRCRHERLLGTVSDVAPILWQYGALARLKKGEKIDKLLYNGYSTISLGYAGLYEMCVRMLGKSHTDPEAKPFALAVMQRLNDKCKEWKDAENISYSVYGTPMESTTYKFAKCLQRRFGIIPGVTDRNYITNSYHVHVTEKIDAFHKLKFESDFQKLSPGGAISYVEVPNMQNNIPAVLAVMKYIYENIMYAELNTKSDYCQVCGYDGEIQIVKDESGKLIWECPNCKNRDANKMNIARRTCGYIGTNGFNQGRVQEIAERELHL